MTPYRVAVDLEALEFLRRSSRRDQELVIRQLLMLAANPFRSGDFSEHDRIGRTVQELIVGGCCISYWADHAVCEVRVVEISPAD